MNFTENQLEKQYEIFFSIFQQENERFKELINRGKIFLSIITVYLGLFTIKLSDLVAITESQVGLFLATVTGSFFILSLLFTCLALGLYRYEALCNIKDELLSIESEKKYETFLC
jgi:hypothetical protein